VPSSALCSFSLRLFIYLARDRGQLYVCSRKHKDSSHGRGAHKLQEVGGDQQSILHNEMQLEMSSLIFHNHSQIQTVGVGTEADPEES